MFKRKNKEPQRVHKINDKTIKVVVIIIAILMLITAISQIFLMNHAYYQNHNISTDDLYQKYLTGEEITVYFYSEKCPKCLKINPLIQSTSKQYGIDIFTFNSETQPYKKFDVEVVPTIIYYKNGEEQNRITGIVSKDELSEFFQENSQS